MLFHSVFLSASLFSCTSNKLHVIKFRVVVVCLQEKIAVLDAFNLTKKFGITSKFDSISNEYYVWKYY